MNSDILGHIRQAFRSEAQEILSELDSALLSLEADPANGDDVDRVFRAIHTVKGSGAMAGFTHLAAVAHKVEEAFDLARSGRLAISAELVDCGLKACDVLRAIMAAENPDAECPGEREVAAALAALLPHKDAKAHPGSRQESHAAAGPPRSAFDVTVRPHRELFYSGSDPMTLLDELRGLGQAHISCGSVEVPLFFDLEPEYCYLWWNVKLVTDRGEAAIREVFNFVEDVCGVSIRLLEDQPSALALLGSIPAESLELFAIECQEHLESIESAALELERDSFSADSLHAIFRAVHSIKGNAGVLLGQVTGGKLDGSRPLPVLARMAHALESLLEPHLQDGSKAVSGASVTLLLESRDAMNWLLEDLLGRSQGHTVPAHLLQQLGIAVTPPEAASAVGLSAFQNTAAQCLDVLDNCVRQLGEGESGRPLLKTYQRSLRTLAAAATHQKRADLDEPVSAQLRLLEAAMTAGDSLSQQDRMQLQGFVRTLRHKVEGKPIAIDAESAPGISARPVASTSAAPVATIRIDQEKLDRLMRVVGELLVAKGAFPTLVERISAGEDRSLVARALKDAGTGISHIAEELQASVMSIRMLPVKSVFQRFPRLIRDLARTLGKEIQLVVEGETVELDKTILEQIGDPLVHLVRNAVDHGIERPETRLSNGKSAAGRLTLRAANESGNVVIEIEDNGRGLDAGALTRKAVEKGLITPEAAAGMSYAEACRLVFLPGLSTAEKVTDVSGRGVGMDVVSNNIRGLQGTIDIRSTHGQGTVFSIKLPTSLIVSKGILLQAGGQEYILPLNSIRDMVKVPAASVHVHRGLRITLVRGEVYPVFSLAELFGLTMPSSGELSIALVECGKVHYGLMADRFINEVEVLVKPLTGGLEHCREFHGAAILGDGRVVLVLNPLECHRLKATASS